MPTDGDFYPGQGLRVPETIRCFHLSSVIWWRFVPGLTVSRRQPSAGRPRVRHVIVDLTVKFAKANPTGAANRSQGALANVGYKISDTTVGNILNAHGVEAAPSRRRTGSWETLLKTSTRAGTQGLACCYRGEEGNMNSLTRR
jgi:hypothetical protein